MANGACNIEFSPFYGQEWPLKPGSILHPFVRAGTKTPGRPFTCLSVTSTRLELCGPGADGSLSLWHVVVIVVSDNDTRADALGLCRASCGLLRL